MKTILYYSQAQFSEKPTHLPCASYHSLTHVFEPGTGSYVIASHFQDLCTAFATGGRGRDVTDQRRWESTDLWDRPE